ncbi:MULTISPECIES: MFS transporter [Heyndrickxia]|uniref:MFS transporter n=1 Tax=Heyndrickxia coagulans TaxID=1398 RepID=A0AAW7C8L1_HEYCO|nr:MFS transporter [Heyndrickxia coagulans]KYC62644.1 hypothetical protein B4100_0879 [Heyndrickxia coagulans]MDL5039829.1 MFS transporter [Heyndrickxia coagulans]MED4344180.1 MFS transporter [Heyndrickxia coagulans]
MRELLTNRFVRMIFLSELFLQAGIWVRNFAVLLFVTDKTNGNPLAVSMISVADYLPIFIFSFIGGAYADRWQPKKTMIWCDLLSAASVFAVIGALIFGSWQVIFFAMLVSSTLSQFSQPSGLKLFKMHLEESLIQQGMAVYQTIYAVFMIFGPVIGTFAYQRLGIDLSITITGVAFLLSAAALSFIPRDEKVKKAKNMTNIFQEMKSGVRYVLAKKELRLLGCGFLTAGLGVGFIQPMNIFLVTDRLGLPKEYLQWLVMVNGIGMIAGGAFSMFFSRSTSPLKLLVTGLLANALGLAVIGASTSLWLTLAAELVSGLFLPSIQIGISTMVLQNTESDYIGRVNGTLYPLFTGAMVITMSLAGLVKVWLSVTAVFEIAALFFIIGLCFAFPLMKERSHAR